MKDLSDRTDIIITKADKGGAVVIMDVKDYINETHRHHKILNKDPATTNVKMYNPKIKKRESTQRKNCRWPESVKPKTLKFCMKPKLHKKVNLGRPIVSSVNCHTSGISKYVDYHLQPVVKDIPSYARDTKAFLTKLNDIRHIPKESLLVILDVNPYIPTFLTVKVLKLSEKLMTNTRLNQYQQK